MLGEAAHESDVLGDVVQPRLGLEDQQVVAGDNAGLAAGLQGLPHGGDRHPPIQVVGPALRGVFHTDVETNHAQLGQVAREIRRDGIGPALTHESRALHARLVEIALDGPDARQTVGGPGQQEVFVVEAKDCAAPHRPAQHGQLGCDVFRRAQSQQLAVRPMSAGIAQHAGDRTETAGSPAAAASAHRNKGDAHVARVRPIAARDGQVVEVVRQAARSGPHHGATGVTERDTGHVSQVLSGGQRREQSDDGSFTVVENHAVHAVATCQNFCAAHGGEVAPGGDVSAKSGLAQGRGQRQEVQAAVLVLRRQADQVGIARRDPVDQVWKLGAVIEAQHLHPVASACGGCRNHAHAQVFFDIGANESKSHFGPPFIKPGALLRPRLGP